MVKNKGLSFVIFKYIVEYTFEPSIVFGLILPALIGLSGLNWQGWCCIWRYSLDNGTDVSRVHLNAPDDVTRAFDESRTPRIRTQRGPEPHGQRLTRRSLVHLRPPLANSAARPLREDGDGKKQAWRKS